MTFNIQDIQHDEPTNGDMMERHFRNTIRRRVKYDHVRKLSVGDLCPEDHVGFMKLVFNLRHLKPRKLDNAMNGILGIDQYKAIQIL